MMCTLIVEREADGSTWVRKLALVPVVGQLISVDGEVWGTVCAVHLNLCDEVLEVRATVSLTRPPASDLT